MEKSQERGVFFLCTLVCVGCFFLPLDQSCHASWLPYYFVAKMLGCYLGILLSLWGMGSLLSIPLFKVAGSVFFTSGGSPQDSSPSTQRVRFFFTTFLGLFLAGLVTFLLGLVFPPQKFQATILFYIGIFLAFLQRSELQKLWKEGKAILETSVSDKFFLLIFSILLIFSVIRVFSVFDFQNHEDSYLYHLSLSERWIYLGHTGVILDNITSGYALSIEHFYLFVKLLVVGNAEQNALSQLFHGTIGFGTFVCVFYSLARKRFDRIWCLGFLTFFLQPTFLSFSLLPKNDAFVLAVVALSLWGLLNKQYAYFWGAALLACAVKITTAVHLLSLGLIYPIFYCTTKKEFYTYTRILFFAVCLCILGFFPFAANNMLVTKNPFFPLLNDIFTSPYASNSMQSIVQEMTPFSINRENLLSSLVALLRNQAIFSAGLLFFFILWIRKRVHPDRLVLFISMFSMCDFLFLILFLGPFGKRVEDRHFLIPLACLTLLALLAIYNGLKGNRYERKIFILIFLSAISISHVDSSLRTDFRFLQKTQLTQDFFTRKSLIKMNADLSALQKKNTKVLAFTHSNTSYFLENGIFWHKSLSFPVLFWDLNQMSEGDWVSKIKTHNITHMIVPRDLKDTPVNLKGLLTHKIRESQNEDLYDMNAVSSFPDK